MKTFKLLLENCIAVYPNFAKLFEKERHSKEGNQEIDCFFGFGVSYAVFFIGNDCLNEFRLYRRNGELVSIAKLLKGQRVNRYWKHQFVCRDYKGNDLFKPNIGKVLAFYEFVQNNRDSLITRESYNVCQKELWQQFYSSQDELIRSASMPFVNYPAIEIETDPQCQLASIRFTLAARLTSMSQYILQVSFDNGRIRNIIDWGSKNTFNIIYPQKERDVFIFQDFNGNTYDIKTNSEANNHSNIRIKGFSEFWEEGRQTIDYYTNIDFEKEMESKGVFIRQQRELLCEDEKMLAWLPTINFHIKQECNMHCRHCFAEFGDIQGKCVGFDDAKSIICEIGSIPAFRKITFSGGEPTLFKGIEDLLCLAHDCGLKTSIVTNGSIIKQNKQLLEKIAKYTDIVAFSIDSFDDEQNRRIGRYYGNDKSVIRFDEWLSLVQTIRQINDKVRIKINTVVTKINCNEYLVNKIKELSPDRWKILRMMNVEGQYDENNAKEIIPSDEEFDAFVRNNKTDEDWIVIEGENVMKGSYIMIAPDGTLFNDVKNHHEYSAPILKVGLCNALESTPMIRSSFYGRKGEY